MQERPRTRSKKRNASPDPEPLEEEEEEEEPVIFNPSFASIFHRATAWTAPEFSLAFIVLFGLATWLHKVKFSVTAVGALCWLGLQISASVSRNQGHVDVWYFLGLLGNLVYYLVLGAVWAGFKLYIDIRQDAVPQAVKLALIQCPDRNVDCILSTLPPLVPDIVQNMVSWPLSIAYTITSDPLAIIGKFAYGNLRRHFAYIVVLALANNDGEATLGIFWTLGLVLAYIALGFAWSHAKLYIDVWQGCLPKHLDDELCNLRAKNQTYWVFIQKIKGFVVLWGLTWPFSMLHTLLRHPFRIVFEYIYEISKKKYHWIIQKALQMRFGTNKQD